MRLSLLLLSRRRARLVRRQDGGHGHDARERVHRIFRGLAQGLHLGAAFRRNLDREADVAAAHDDPGNHSERDDILAAAGLDDRSQTVENLPLGHLRHP